MSKYSDIVLADSPSLYWALDATTGATDLSGNARNGTGAGGVSIGGFASTPLVDGTTSTDLNGTTHYLTSTYAPLTNGGAYTFTGWAANDSTAATGYILVGGSSASGFFAFQLVGSTRLLSLYTNGTLGAQWAAGWPTGSAYHHWALVVDDTANTASLYIDGALVSTVAHAPAWGTTAGNIWFGAFAGGQLWDGRMSNVAVFSSALSADTIAALYAARTVAQLQVRQNPPLRLSVNVQPPSGSPFRWGRDEPKAANVPTGLSFTTTAPGGFESCNLTLPRKPKLAYPDLERLSTVTVRGAGGQVAWEGRIENVPRESGSQMAVSPQLVGWQAHLEDNQNARALYVDRDLGGWGNMSRANKLALIAASVTPSDGSVAPDTTTGIPAVVLSFDGNGSTTIQRCTVLYDAGAGLYIGSIYYDIVRGTNVTSSYTAQINTDDADTFPSATTTTGLTTSASTSGTHTAGSQERFGQFILQSPAGSGGANGVLYDMTFRRITVWGNHGLTKRGTAPDDGLYASDVIAHALANFAPLLSYSTGANGTITDSSFIIPQLVFRDPTTAANIIAEANRFHLRDWFVWEGQRAGQPTFYYHDRGARGKTWRARVGPSGLSETGQSMSRLWNGVVVRYSDVDGSTRTVGPTGASADSTSASLIDTDPLNPANKLGINRWAVLDMNGVSTPAGATEVGRRFLVETKALDTSGRADITGYITDDRGTNYPAWRIRAGDYVNFVDASDVSARRVVRTSYDDSTKTCSVDLDAPPDSLDSLLERLQVVLTGIL